jgi:hypothetical protein
MNKSMLLITSAWGNTKTFKLIPITKDCPYNEGIFDADNKVLAIVSKEKKESLHMLAKLNEFGDPLTLKMGRRANGKEYAEERKNLETFYEYYVEDKTEIVNFINMFASNSDTFDFNKYFTTSEKSDIISNPTSIITV